MSNTFEVGQLVRVSVLFANASAVATDPTTVELTYTNPRGDVTLKTFALGQVVKDSSGNYHFDIDVNMKGTWRYAYKGAGALQAADSSAFTAESTVFP